MGESHLINVGVRPVEKLRIDSLRNERPRWAVIRDLLDEHDQLHPKAAPAPQEIPA